MSEMLIIGAIIALALAFTVRHFMKVRKGGGCGCGHCDCGSAGAGGKNGKTGCCGK